MPHLDLLHLAAIARADVTAPLDDASHEYARADEQLAQGFGERLTRRAANWAKRLHAYEDFWAKHGRTPRENTRDRTALPGDERRLGEWARYQRRFEPELNDYQRTRLDISPAFSWDPRETQWQRNYDAIAEHVARTGKLPVLSAQDSTEFALARWLGRQLREVQTHQIARPRRRAIDILLASGRGGAWAPHQTRNTDSPT